MNDWYRADHHSNINQELYLKISSFTGMNSSVGVDISRIKILESLEKNNTIDDVKEINIKKTIEIDGTAFEKFEKSQVFLFFDKKKKIMFFLNKETMQFLIDLLTMNSNELRGISKIIQEY